MILGIDVSTYLEQQRLTHQVYKENGHPIDPFQIFKDQGVTHLRTRIWNNPYSESGEPYLAGTCDLQNALDLAKTLEKYEFCHVIDFHYSDFWVDPSKQFLPKAWVGLSEKELLNAVYEFTRDSLLKLKEANLNVTHVQVGNEITHGMLFPYARLEGGRKRDASFTRLANVLKQGIKGVREVYPNAKVILHLEQSYDQACYREYLSQMRKNKVDFDVLGTSYYPFWHHNFDEYFANMDMVQREFGVEVMNVELGFPFTTIDYKLDEEGKPKHLVINADNIEDFLKLMPFEPSKEGQRKFVKTFIELAKEHHLTGIFYWEPLWIPGDGICWASKVGQAYQNDQSKDTRNEWANQCLFDYDGNALPALKEYKK